MTINLIVKKIENTDFIILELFFGSGEQNTAFGIHYEDSEFQPTRGATPPAKPK